MGAPVFLAEPGDLAGQPGVVTIRRARAQGRHAATVRRLRPGEPVRVVDGRGSGIAGEVAAVTGERVEVHVGRLEFEEPPAVRLVLVQALAKGDRDTRAVEAAVEVGVDAVVPWQAQRSVSVWDGARRERGQRRWEAVVASATKQSRRSWLPQVRPLVREADLAQVVAQAVSAGSQAVVLHEEATEPIGSVRLPPAGEVLVVVGPEGGLTQGEVAGLREAGARVVRLGPHVLRTSTAGPVALAILAERLGRWAAPGSGARLPV